MARGPIPDFPAERPTVPAVVEQARRYRDARGGLVGGALHCYIEDGNTGRSFVDPCLVEQFPDDPDPAATRALCEALFAMTPTQRGKVYRHLD